MLEAKKNGQVLDFLEITTLNTFGWLGNFRLKQKDWKRAQGFVRAIYKYQGFEQGRRIFLAKKKKNRIVDFGGEREKEERN